MDLSLLPDGGMRWLDASGPKSTIVLSTRIRLARNVRGIPFSQRAKDADRTAVLERVIEAAASSDHLSAAVAFHLDQMERAERQLLHERHLVSKELAGLERESRPRPGAALLVQDQVGVMVNEEDHLRLHGMWSGFDLEDAYAAVEAVDRKSTRLNSSHLVISYAGFCLKKTNLNPRFPGVDAFQGPILSRPFSTLIRVNRTHASTLWTHETLSWRGWQS